MAKPEIRIKGFKGEWEEKPLVEEVTLFPGLTYAPNDVSSNGTLVLRSSNVQEGEISLLDNVYVKQEVVNSPYVKKNDIIIVVRNGSRSLIGKHAQIKNEMSNAVIGAFMTGIRSSHPEFINALLSSRAFNKEVEINLGATINQITNGTFHSMKFKFPNEDEQDEIGNYFKSLDSMILGVTKKISSLKQMKQACLVSMFPQAGEAKPRVRYKGFKREWEKDKAGNLFMTFNERNRPDLPVLSANQDIRGMAPRTDTGYNISHNKANEVTYKVVKPGQYVIHLRSFQGGFAHSGVEGITSPAYTVFGFKDAERHDDYFWKIIFMSKEFIKSLETITYGIRDGRSISFGEFAEMNFYFPSKEEQTKIASYFHSLDKQISLQEARLEKLKQIKSASLDKMFV